MTNELFSAIFIEGAYDSATENLMTDYQRKNIRNEFRESLGDGGLKIEFLNGLTGENIAQIEDSQLTIGKARRLFK